MKIWRCKQCGAWQEKGRKPQKCPACAAGKEVLVKSTVLSDLKVSSFAHPWDQEALELMKKIPLFDEILRWISRNFLDRLEKLDRVGADYRITAENDPQLFRKLEFGLKVLDLSNKIDLYVWQHPAVTAYSAGIEETFIVISSGAMERLNDEEMIFLIGHELGHIKANHVLYQSLARNMLKALNWLGPLKFVGRAALMTVLIALFDWYRKSELTADRAGALCIQNNDIPINVMVKLATGQESEISASDRKSFIEQSDHYQELRGINVFVEIYELFKDLYRSHPHTVLRAREVNTWMKEGEYRQIIGTK